MNRDDAVRKVGALMRLHADDRGSAEERQSALEQATKLRLKFGISDHALELELASEEMGDTEFFGHLLFFYGRNIAPHVEAIRAEIAAAIAKMDKLDPLNKAETYSKLYRELRDITEGSSWAASGIGFKPKRDAAVKALYQQVAYQYAASHDNRDRGLHFDRMMHEWARDRTASACDIRKDTVERIVRVFEKDFYKREAAEIAARVCEACGLDGNDDRQWCQLYDYEDGKPGRYLHPVCREVEEKANASNP